METNEGLERKRLALRHVCRSMSVYILWMFWDNRLQKKQANGELNCTVMAKRYVVLGAGAQSEVELLGSQVAGPIIIL